jgi:hypothetical protein
MAVRSGANRRSGLPGALRGVSQALTPERCSLDPRPVIHHLDPTDLDRSVSDPRLSMLAAKGWTVAAYSVTQLRDAGGAEQQRLTLVLWPPAQEAGPSVRTAIAVHVACWLGGAAIGAALALAAL